MKILLTLIIMVITMYSNVSAQSLEDVIKQEEDIKAAGTAQVKYAKQITIDFEMLSLPVSRAYEKKSEYASIRTARKPFVNVQLDIKGGKNSYSFVLDKSIADYAEQVDNIIINCNDIYCYIQPQKFKNNQDDSIEITINDNDKIISKYNGTAALRKTQKILMIIFIIIAAVMLIFLANVPSMNLRKGIKKKNIYVIGSIIVLLCLFDVAVLAIVEPSGIAKAKKLDDGQIHTFTLGGASKISGVYMGIPLFEKSFDAAVTVAAKTDDETQAEEIIGGNYLRESDVVKFPVTEKGDYYLKNNTVVFTDSTTNDEFLTTALTFLAARDIVKGKTGGIFGADDNITRAEIVTMLCQMLSLDTENPDRTQEFGDVKSQSWYYKYVMTGRSEGLLEGFDDGSFRPDENITRQQMASIAGQFMINRLGYTPADDLSILYEFEDEQEMAEWAKPYIALMVRENINLWEDYYEPTRVLTRGEAVIILYRLYLLM